ncbi:MAG: arylsulfatase [Planctomycetota bacterium]|jgi:arylsulfatase
MSSVLSRFTAILFAVLLSMACAEQPETEPTRPRNVILFLVDTLRSDRLGCYGYERNTSPTIDRLASAGTLFERNYAQGYWTVPSMISIMSGLYVTDDETALSEDVPTLGETLNKAGIMTAAFVGNRVLTNSRGFERGIDFFQGPNPGGRAQPLVSDFLRWYTDNEKQIKNGKGFFAWIHPFDPHEPYRPKPEFRVFTGPRPDESNLQSMWESEAKRAKEIDPDHEHPSLEEAIEGIREESNMYDGEVLAVDAGMERLLGILNSIGELDRTLIIFAADHGETHCEHPEYPMGTSVHMQQNGKLERGMRDLMLAGHRGFRDEVWRTPLIMAGPGFEAGARKSHLTANLDLYPTILEAFGIAAPPHLAGKSLWNNAHPEHGEIFAHSFGTEATVNEDGFKLIEHSYERYLQPATGPRPIELFHVDKDPDEVINFADESEETAESMRARIKAWREANRRAFISETSKEARETLLDLGYTGY